MPSELDACTIAARTKMLIAKIEALDPSAMDMVEGAIMVLSGLSGLPYITTLYLLNEVGIVDKILKRHLPKQKNMFADEDEDDEEED